MSGATTPVFHRYYDELDLKPAYVHHAAARARAAGVDVHADRPHVVGEHEAARMGPANVGTPTDRPRGVVAIPAHPATPERFAVSDA